jgi:hypothetical protein
VTIAICTECGRTKFGAFSPCDHCGYTPSSDAERAKSVILSDHYYKFDELIKFSELIQSGQHILYDPASVAMYEKLLGCLESDPEALQCAACGEDRDSFDSTLCSSCRASQDAAE